MNIPKKRHIAAGLAVLYIISKVIVSFTANPADDDIPDRVKDIVMRIAMVSPDSTNG